MRSKRIKGSKEHYLLGQYTTCFESALLCMLCFVPYKQHSFEPLKFYVIGSCFETLAVILVSDL